MNRQKVLNADTEQEICLMLLDVKYKKYWKYLQLKHCFLLSGDNEYLIEMDKELIKLIKDER